MLTKLVLVSVVTACATTGKVSPDRDPVTHGRVELDLVRASDVVAVFPRVLDPSVPRVDHLAPIIRSTLGDTATAELALCVTPAGRVASVAVVASTSLPALDAALAADARDWHFASQPGPAGVQTCERTRVTYLAR